MGRIIAAVAAGYAAIGILVTLTDQVFAMSMPGFSQTHTPPASYFAMSLITDALYTVIGGFLCALIARDKARKAILGLVGFGELMGLVAMAAMWNTVPHWYSFALLAIYPPAVLIGGRIRSGKVKATAIGA